jgi:hypothetical protein
MIWTTPPRGATCCSDQVPRFRPGDARGLLRVLVEKGLPGMSLKRAEMRANVVGIGKRIKVKSCPLQKTNY